MAKQKKKTKLNIGTIILIGVIIFLFYSLQNKNIFSTTPTNISQPTQPTPTTQVIIDFSKKDIDCNENTIGTITSNLPNYACIIYYNKDNTGWMEYKSVTLDSNGHYSESQSSASGGTYVWRVVCGTKESNQVTVTVTCCKDSDNGIDIYIKGTCRDALVELIECCTGSNGGYCASPETYDTHVLENSCSNDACIFNPIACPANELCLDGSCRSNWGYSEPIAGRTPDPDGLTYMNVYCSSSTISSVSCSFDAGAGGGFSSGGPNACPTWHGSRESSGQHTYDCAFTYLDGSTITHTTDVFVS